MDKVYLFYKIGNFFYKIKLTPISIVIRILMRLIFSCDISYKTKIGKGTIFPHMALGVTIHQDAIIGENCIIMQNVTIGGRSGKNKLPVLGNNVLVGANSVVIGPVKIGDNVSIGAGSIVIDDIESNSVVCCSKAKRIK